MPTDYDFHAICITWLSNYLIHSTLIILLMIAVARVWRAYSFNGLDLVWRTALIGGVLTATMQSVLPSVHWGPRLSLPTFLESNAGEFRPGTRDLDSQGMPPIGQAIDAGSEIRVVTPTAIAVGETPRNALDTTALRLDPKRYALFVFLLICGAAATLTLLRLGCDWIRLRRVERQAEPLLETHWREAIRALAARIHIRKIIRMLKTGKLHSPLAAGCIRLRILIPERIVFRLDQKQARALLAHELAHLARRDPLWSLIAEVICGVFFFQPLNFFVRRQLRFATELHADRAAAELLNDPVVVARTLVDLSEWIAQSAANGRPVSPGWTLQMAGNRSFLRERVECLLDQRLQSHSIPRRRRQVFTVASVCLILIMSFVAPGAVSTQQSAHAGPNTAAATSGLADVALLSTTTRPSMNAPESNTIEKPAGQAVAETVPTPIAVPRELQNFSGQLIGRLVSKDVEAGSFVVTVDHVSRVWRDNKAENPKIAVGNTFVVDRVFGRWLDALLILKPGDSLEFEARHSSGDKLSFLGETLRKTAPVNLANYPNPPDEFRGFHGVVVGKVLIKDEARREMVLHVKRIPAVASQNTAKMPTSSVGEPIMIAGIYGKMLDPFRKIKSGDTIRAEIDHYTRQSDHFSLGTILETVSPIQPAQESTDRIILPEGMHGFRGILVGRLLNKDVEHGTLIFEAGRVKRVWKESKAQDLNAAHGRIIAVRGISGNFLDILSLLKRNDRIEIEAFHNGGDHLEFVGEWLKKVDRGKAPVAMQQSSFRRRALGIRIPTRLVPTNTSTWSAL